MANPEHFKIFMAGKKAINEWMKENQDKYPEFGLTMDLSNATISGIDLSEAYLACINFREATFRDVELWSVFMMGCDLQGASLRKLDICFGNFNGSNITGAHFEESLLSHATFEDVHCRGASFKYANLSFASLAESEFVSCNFRNADLRYALFLKTNLHGSKLDAVKLSAVNSANWDITNVSCTHFFHIDPNDDDNWFSGVRVPSKGFLAPGEFEDRLKLNNLNDSWITITEAADLLVIHRGVVSRWATEGKIKDNKETGKQRRVLLSDVLLQKHKRENRELLKDAKDLRRDSQQFH